MTQFRYYITAAKSCAELYYGKLFDLFQEEAFPLAINEKEKDSLLFEVSLYINDQEISLFDKDAWRIKIAKFLDIDQKNILIEILPDCDWVQHSLAALKPVRAGQFLIYGEHDKDKVKPEDLAIKIEASQAFGTGHHDTTTGCLLLLEAILDAYDPKSILDIGTGSGILAIACAKILQKNRKKAKIIATDIDPIAVDIAKENFYINKVSDHIYAIEADGLENDFLKKEAPFQCIIANILANPLVALAPSIKAFSEKNTLLILSGILEEQAETIIKTYQEQGFTLQKKILSNSWVSLFLTLETI